MGILNAVLVVTDIFVSVMCVRLIHESFKGGDYWWSLFFFFMLVVEVTLLIHFLTVLFVM